MSVYKLNPATERLLGTYNKDTKFANLHIDVLTHTMPS